MYRGTAFPSRLHERPAKTLIDLHVLAVWSVSSAGTQRVAKDPKRFQADSEDADQTAFAGCTCNLVENDVSRLKIKIS